jgi:hypothetical protein
MQRWPGRPFIPRLKHGGIRVSSLVNAVQTWCELPVIGVIGENSPQVLSALYAASRKEPWMRLRENITPLHGAFSWLVGAEAGICCSSP